ncbi:MAG TPA: hypothetical protein PLE68_01465 [Bacillota bacterium]|nr:hypothetical protein [Bacillota bacterium]
MTAMEAEGGFFDQLNEFFNDRKANDVILDYQGETSGNIATASGTFKAYLKSGSVVGGSFSFYFIKDGDHWRMNRLYIGPGGSGDNPDDRP